jgi:hypothetical protein
VTLSLDFNSYTHPCTNYQIRPKLLKLIMHFLRSIFAFLSAATGAYSLCIDTIDNGNRQSSAQVPITATKSINATLISQLYKPNNFVYKSTFGMIQRGNDPEKDISTYLTFDFPSDAKGKQCTFALYLERWAQVCPDGSVPLGSKCSGNFALFSTNSPAKDGGPAPVHKDYVGELQAKTSNWAAWIQPTSQPKKIACPDTGKATFSLVPTGNADYIYFPFSPGANSFAAFYYS